MPEFWDEYTTGDEHYRCSICGNIGPIPQTTEERDRRRAEHLAAAHSDGDGRTTVNHEEMWEYIEQRAVSVCQCADCKAIRFLVAELTKAQVVAEELENGSGHRCHQS